MAPEQLAARLGWEIIGTAQVQTYAAAQQPASWSVLCPRQAVAGY